MAKRKGPALMLWERPTKMICASYVWHRAELRSLWRLRNRFTLPSTSEYAYWRRVYLNRIARYRAELARRTEKAA
jgi:hypothetical protein